MLRTLDTLRASVQGHISKSTRRQTIIHSQTVASTGSCEAVRAVYERVVSEQVAPLVRAVEEIKRALA